MKSYRTGFHGSWQGPPRGKIQYSETQRVKTYLPIGLSVNQESREETLKHYAVVPIQQLAPIQVPPSNRPRARMALCVRLGLDTAAFLPPQTDEWDSFSVMKERQELWFNHINSCAPHLLRKIEKLEVAFGRDLRTMAGPTGRYFKIVFCEASRVLNQFPSLKTLLITINKVPAYHAMFSREAPDRRDEESIRDDVKAWLEKGLEDAGSDVSCLPKIIVRFGRRGWACFADEEEAWDSGALL